MNIIGIMPFCGKNHHKNTKTIQIDKKLSKQTFFIKKYLTTVSQVGNIRIR